MQKSEKIEVSMRTDLDPLVDVMLRTVQESFRQLIVDHWAARRRETDDNVSQRVIADSLGFGQSEVSDYLKNKRIPSLEKIIKLALVRDQQPEDLLAQLFNRSLGSSSIPLEQQVRSLDATAKFDLMKLLVMELSGGSPEVLDAGRKITPQMIDLLDLEETIDLVQLLIERQRVLLKDFSAKKVSR
jgi:transcriptional regulator with XRE-family HTH domain